MSQAPATGSKFPFRVISHTFPSQHIREYARASAFSEEEVFQIAVKQYIPLDNASPQPGDVTIVGAAANGFPKELYEPLWEDIFAQSKKNGFRIRGIWIADRANSGESGVLNERVLGNDPSWLDHARDLLQMTNVFRHQMPLPIIGLGHSLGANEIANLSLMHPRLLTSVILLDPIIQSQTISKNGEAPAPGGVPARLSAYRRDIWPTLSAAVESMKKQTYYKSWDPRVLDRWLRFGFRELPTVIYPSGEKGGEGGGEKAATLTTTKHHEVFNYLRPWYSESHPSASQTDLTQFPDTDPSPTVSKVPVPFYRPEVKATFRRLPNLRPGCLYIFGGKSEISPPALQKEKVETTGVGVGGSGGVKAGRVKGVVLKDVGHLVAMQDPGRCAEEVAEWMGGELELWRREKKEFEKWTREKTVVEKQTISDERRRRLGGPLRGPMTSMKGGAEKGKL